MQYFQSEMTENVRQASEASILRGDLTHAQVRLLMEHFEKGFSSYTYLEGIDL